jgi:hypothetical protein
MPPVIEGTLQEIVKQYPELVDKRVRVYVIEDAEHALNLLEFLGDWVGSVHIPDSFQATQVEQVVEQVISDKIHQRAQR